MYSTISRIKIFDSLLERSGVTEIPPFMAYIHQLAAVQYFQLASWWENVPYVISYDNSFAVTKQLVSRDLFANLVEDLNYCVEHSKLEPGKFDSSESFYIHHKALRWLYWQRCICIKSLMIKLMLI